MGWTVGTATLLVLELLLLLNLLDFIFTPRKEWWRLFQVDGKLIVFPFYPKFQRCTNMIWLIDKPSHGYNHIIQRSTTKTIWFLMLDVWTSHHDILTWLTFRRRFEQLQHSCTTILQQIHTNNFYFEIILVWFLNPLEYHDLCLREWIFPSHWGHILFICTPFSIF